MIAALTVAGLLVFGMVVFTVLIVAAAIHHEETEASFGACPPPGPITGLVRRLLGVRIQSRTAPEIDAWLNEVRSLPSSAASPLPSPSAATPPLVLTLLASGASCDAAARELGVHPEAVRKCLRETCERLGMRTPIQAATWARDGAV